jgi:hypothetical protein
MVDKCRRKMAWLVEDDGTATGGKKAKAKKGKENKAKFQLDEFRGFRGLLF